MAKTIRVTQEKRFRCVFLHEQGKSFREIGRTLKIDHKTVKAIVVRHKKTGSVDDLPRSGRPRKTSPRDDRKLKRSSLNDRRKTAIGHMKDLKDEGINLSESTVRRRLREHGLFGRVARKKPLLRAYNVKKRLAWAKSHKHWTTDDWRKVIWSDESKFTLFQTTGKSYVRRRAGEAHLPECIVPTVKHGGGNVMVWGCFRAGKKGKLHWIKDTMDQHVYANLLQHQFLPSAKSLAEEFGGLKNTPVQQDNDPKHSSKLCDAKFKRYFTNRLEWVAQSPDMSPIEQLWEELERRLRHRNEKPTSKQHLFDMLKEEWNNIPEDVTYKLVDSMPRRVDALINSKGHHTKY